VIAWGFTEISTAVAETFSAPDWLLRTLMLGFEGDFPVTVLLSWLYDLRVTRTEESSTGIENPVLLKIAAIELLAKATIGLYVLIPLP